MCVCCICVCVCVCVCCISVSVSVCVCVVHVCLCVCVCVCVVSVCVCVCVCVVSVSLCVCVVSVSVSVCVCSNTNNDLRAITPRESNKALKSISPLYRLVYDFNIRQISRYITDHSHALSTSDVRDDILARRVLNKDQRL